MKQNNLETARKETISKTDVHQENKSPSSYLRSHFTQSTLYPHSYPSINIISRSSEHKKPFPNNPLIYRKQSETRFPHPQLTMRKPQAIRQANPASQSSLVYQTRKQKEGRINVSGVTQHLSTHSDCTTNASCMFMFMLMLAAGTETHYIRPCMRGCTSPGWMDTTWHNII